MWPVCDQVCACGTQSMWKRKYVEVCAKYAEVCAKYVQSMYKVCGSMWKRKYVVCGKVCGRQCRWRWGGKLGSFALQSLRRARIGFVLQRSSWSYFCTLYTMNHTFARYILWVILLHAAYYKSYFCTLHTMNHTFARCILHTVCVGVRWKLSSFALQRRRVRAGPAAIKMVILPNDTYRVFFLTGTPPKILSTKKLI